jgi:hypothetical protein
VADPTESPEPATDASPKGATRMSPWGLLESQYPEGSWEAEEDMETQALVLALKQLPRPRVVEQPPTQLPTSDKHD